GKECLFGQIAKNTHCPIELSKPVMHSRRVVKANPQATAADCLVIAQFKAWVGLYPARCSQLSSFQSWIGFLVLLNSANGIVGALYNRLRPFLHMQIQIPSCALYHSGSLGYLSSK